MAKKTINITLYMSELIYDVENKTFLTGRSRKAEAMEAGSESRSAERTANMMANEDDEIRNQVLRSLTSAFASLKTKLSEYLNESGTTANNVLLSDSTNLVVSLEMPSNFNETTRVAVATAMHQYMVNMAIGEWFVMTDKADAGDYLGMAAANIEQVHEAINKRVRPLRPTPAG